MTWFYNLLIGVGGFIIGLLTFLDEIAKKFPILKSISSLIIKIPFFLLASVFIIWGSIAKDNEANTKDEIEKAKQANDLKVLDSTFRVEKRISDSQHEIKITALLDSSYVKSIKASNDALAKYNLVYIDSLHKVASSINNKSQLAQLAINPAATNDPQVYLADEGSDKWLNVKYSSINGTSYNISFSMYIVKIYGSDFRILVFSDYPENEEFLVPDRTRTTRYLIPNNILNEEEVYIVFIGSFSRDNEGKISFPFKDSYRFNFKERKMPFNQTKINFKKFEEYLKNNPPK